MTDPNSNTHIEYAKQFWSLSNAITAFAAVQALSYLYAIGASDSKIVAAVLASRRCVVVCIVAVSLSYCAMIFVLGRWERTILKDHHMTILSVKSSWVMYGRLFAVATAGLAASWLTL